MALHLEHDRQIGIGTDDLSVEVLREKMEGRIPENTFLFSRDGEDVGVVVLDATRHAEMVADMASTQAAIQHIFQQGFRRIGRGLNVMTLHVAEGHQGKGIGTGMAIWVSKLATHEGASFLYGNCPTSAVGFYKKNHFDVSTVGEAEFGYRAFDGADVYTVGREREDFHSFIRVTGTARDLLVPDVWLPSGRHIVVPRSKSPRMAG